MKVLLSDGSSVTSRHLVNILNVQGHDVHLLCPPGLTLTKFTRNTTRFHVVPPFGYNPYDWLDAALATLRREHFDVLVCAHEQVAILSAEVEQIRELGVRISVPRFHSLRRVMDKASAWEALRDAVLPQPETLIVRSADEISQHATIFPGYLKTPIGTGSTGVRFAKTVNEAVSIARQYEIEGAFDSGGQLVLQKSVPGPVLMVSAIFDSGQLVAWHSCLKVRDGIGGGGAKKLSLPLPFVADDLSRLGALLKWDGALSLDAIFAISEQKAYYIDLNPRIVEPTNSLLSGVDLVGHLLAISHAGVLEKRPESSAKIGAASVASHQFLLTLLASAQTGRLAVINEVASALMGNGEYADSTEELTPFRNDIQSCLFMTALIAMLLFLGEGLVKRLQSSTTSKHALSVQGWRYILERQAMINM
jgi:hypothetical protein